MAGRKEKLYPFDDETQERIKKSIEKDVEERRKESPPVEREEPTAGERFKKLTSED